MSGTASVGCVRRSRPGRSPTRGARPCGCRGGRRLAKSPRHARAEGKRATVSRETAESRAFAARRKSSGLTPGREPRQPTPASRAWTTRSPRQARVGSAARATPSGAKARPRGRGLSSERTSHEPARGSVLSVLVLLRQSSRLPLQGPRGVSGRLEGVARAAGAVAGRGSGGLPGMWRACSERCGRAHASRTRHAFGGVTGSGTASDSIAVPRADELVGQREGLGSTFRCGRQRRRRYPLVDAIYVARRALERVQVGRRGPFGERPLVRLGVASPEREGRLNGRFGPLEVGP